MRHCFALSLAVVFSFVLLCAAAKPAELNLTDLSGRKVHLKDYRGKIIVLNFWATWCGPCKEELPMLVEVEKEWSARGILFIGASLDDHSSAKKVPAFMEKFGIRFPIWVGASAADLDRLGMGEAVPDTAFIDENGMIFARVLGEIRKNELTERLEWATGDRKGPMPKSFVKHL